MRRRLLLAALAAVLAAPAWADPQEDAVDYFRAVQLDASKTVQRLLAQGLDPNIREPERGETGLIVAMRYDANKTLDVLLAQPRIDLEARAGNGNTALMMAAFRKNKPAVLKLLDKGAQVNQKGWAALHYAAAAGDVELTKLFLDKHAYIDAESPSGMTPLMIAAREGQEQVVKLLLEEGADATLKDGGFHLTAAGFALKYDKPWIAEAINAFLANQKPR
jgi:ankyrin repeat protein